MLRIWPWTQNENYSSPGIMVISMDIFRGFAVIFSHKSMIFSLGQKQITEDQSSLVESEPEGATHSPSTTSRQPQKVPSQQDSAPASCRNAHGDLCDDFSPFLPKKGTSDHHHHDGIWAATISLLPSFCSSPILPKGNWLGQTGLGTEQKSCSK